MLRSFSSLLTAQAIILPSLTPEKSSPPIHRMRLINPIGQNATGQRGINVDHATLFLQGFL